MSLFRILWLRRFMRRHMTPLPQDRAEFWKSRLAVLYAFFAWNAFGWVIYQVVSGKADWAKHHGLVSEEEAAKTPAQQWAKTLQLKNTTVYRVKGFNVSRYEINDESEESEENEEKETNESTEE